MEFTLFGYTFDKNAVRVLMVFACVCLIMTGHFISSALSAPAGDVTVTITHGGANGGANGAGGSAAAAAGADADGGAGGGSGGAGANGTGAAAAGPSGDAPAASIAAGSAAPAGNSGAPGGSGGAGAETGAAQAAGEAAPYGANGAYGANSSGAAPVRDGYSLPGGTNADARYIPDQEKIYVYVTGAVHRPGVYALARSSMVIDAVELAGGFTEQADAENVNMVFRLESNAMLNIKRKPQQYAFDFKQNAPGVSGTGAAGASGTGSSAAADNPNVSELYGSAVEISYNYDGALLTGDNSGGGAETAGARRININTAPADELMTLPGIGKATADSIIAYRSKQKFNRIEDLMKVSGIKQAKFDAVKDMITC